MIPTECIGGKKTHSNFYGQMKTDKDKDKDKDGQSTIQHTNGVWDEGVPKLV